MKWSLIVGPSLVSYLVFTLAFISLSGIVGDEHPIKSVDLRVRVSAILSDGGVIYIVLYPYALRDRYCGGSHGV